MTQPKLKIETWPIDRVINYARNARLHSDTQIASIAGSIKEFGFINPCLVDDEGTLIAGHGRIMACKSIGIDVVPIIRLGHLNENQIKALRIADNQLPMLAEWSPEMLRLELTDLSLAGYDMPLLGFDNVQLVQFMANVPTGNDPEATPEPPANPVSRTGDLWLLGKHRLLCGDSTKAKDVERVLGDTKPNLLVSDPPYGVEYDANWRNETGIAEDGSLQPLKTGRVRKSIGAKAIGKVENDDRADWSEAWKLFPGDVAYCWHAGQRASDVDLSFRAAGFEVRCQIIWNKGRMIIGRGDYHWAHEPCWYLVRKGSPGKWSGDRKQTTMWDIEHRASETGHSTQKPIECMRRPIQNNSKPGDYVYEPFCGSGTTIIAAEMMNRYCLAIELAPNYVDVAVQRWQTFAKAEATLDGDGRTFAEIAQDRTKEASKRSKGKSKGSAPASRKPSSGARKPGKRPSATKTILLK